MKRIRIIGLAVVAVFALSAVAASAASAHTFKAETAKVKVKASSTFGSPAVEHLHGFQASNAVTVCKLGTFEGEGTSGAETLEVHPVYTGCSVALSGTFGAEVVTEGCNYLFVAKEPGTPFKLEPKAVSIVCKENPATKKPFEIHVKIPGLSCEINVPGAPANQELSSIAYKNEGEGTGRKVLVGANVTGITYKSNCAALTVKEGANAEYRAGKFSGGLVPEMAAGPAEALSEGRNSLNQADGIWVE